jgi:hypothetical protein
VKGRSCQPFELTLKFISNEARFAPFGDAGTTLWSPQPKPTAAQLTSSALLTAIRERHEACPHDHRHRPGAGVPVGVTPGHRAGHSGTEAVRPDGDPHLVVARRISRSGERGSSPSSRDRPGSDLQRELAQAALTGQHEAPGETGSGSARLGVSFTMRS